MDIKTKLPEFIDAPKCIFPVLYHITNNEVGSITLKLLKQAIKNMKKKIKIKLGMYCPSTGKIYKNLFIKNEMTIYISYKEAKNLQCVGYCAGKLFPQKCNLDEILFHELNHALHYVTGILEDDKIDTLSFISDADELNELKELWTDDEELRTIAGKYVSDGNLFYDPLNCNLYSFYEARANGVKPSEISQRIFHRAYGRDICLKKYLTHIRKTVTNFNNFFVDWKR